MEGAGIAAGWYADPWGQAALRWWDGGQWTGHVAEPVRREPVRHEAARSAASPLSGLVPAGGRVAVVDVETTGLYSSDRVVEIGIVTLDERGQVLDEFETLVNPCRDVGPTWLHQITASMVADAPTFDEVAGHVAARLDGSVLCAHNLPFDQRMLRGELSRVGVPVEWGTGLDTLSVTGCKLGVACEAAGIALSAAHRALADARATARLLVATAGQMGGTVLPAELDLSHTPVGPAQVVTRDGQAQAPVDTPYLVSLAATVHVDVDLAPYVDLLDIALADLKLTPGERAELSAIAAALGLDARQVARAHKELLSQMIDAAIEDHVVTADEYEQLCRAAALLDIEIDLVDRHTDGLRSTMDVTDLRPGSTVCFTGTAVDEQGQEIDRYDLEMAAKTFGLTPVGSVTKSGCDLLVAADPASRSGKAAKARKYGVPIASVDRFLAALDGAPLEISRLASPGVALVCTGCGDSWLASRRSSRPRCTSCR